MRLCSAITVLMLLVGCSNAENNQSKTQPKNGAASNTTNDTISGTLKNVHTPLTDLNIDQSEIPETLQKISDNPYLIPKHLSCRDIRAEIADLDSILGPEVVGPQQAKGFVDREASFVRQQAVGFVTNKINILPFRGIIRHVTGADRHAKAVDRAYNAGRLRRAFLKGLASERGSHCLTITVANK